MNHKKIYRYSNVELLDLIKNSQNKSLICIAKDEFEKRNLTEDKKQQLELDYLKHKEFQEKRKNEPLTNDEWFTFFFYPFFTPKPNSRNDHYSESELKRFKTYGFKKKLKQADKVKSFGLVFWFLLVIIATLLYVIFELI